MKLVRPVLALTSGLALALGSTASFAAAKPAVLNLTDPAGDANALNGQGGVTGDPFNGTGTPVGSQADKDIVSEVFTSTYAKKACTGFTVDLTFTGTPGTNTNFRVLGTGPVNTSTWWLTYNGTRSYIRYSAGTAASADLATPVVVKDKTVTFTVLEADLKATGESLKSFVLTGPGADIRTLVPGAGVTLPMWDTLPESDKTFKPC